MPNSRWFANRVNSDVKVAAVAAGTSKIELRRRQHLAAVSQ